jgi:preprotein translocase subunit YajC
VGGTGRLRRWGRNPSGLWLPDSPAPAAAKPILLEIQPGKYIRTEFPLDPMSILLFVMLGVFIFMMFRRNKKTQQQQAELQSKFGPGVDVMTSFGLYGRIVDIDEAENKVTLELSPGNTATVHRQAVTKIVEPAAVPEAASPAVPDDASSITVQDTGSSAATVETPEETLKRLNDEGKKDN